MPKKKQKEDKADAKRLADCLSKTSQYAETKHGRKSPARPRNGGDAGRTVNDARPVSPLIRLIQSLGEEEIRFQIVGMSAAVLQGVMMTTLDTDIWVDLPERQYIRLTNLCVKQGASALAPTLYVLADGRVVNFLFRVDGIRSFKTEYKNAVLANIGGEEVRVLPLSRILQSKKTILRDKDKLHILAIENVLKANKETKNE